VNLLRKEGGPLVIGHRGALSDAPENSARRLVAAVGAGADVVEFDVSKGLFIAHSPEEQQPDALTFDAALELLAPHGIGLHVDVKYPGYEAEVVDAVRRHGVADRTYFSSAWPGSVRKLAQHGIPTAMGYPRDRYGLSRVRWPAPLTAAGAAAARALMPVRIPLLLRRTGATALSLHRAFCSTAAVAAAHRRGVPVIVWTVNDPDEMNLFAAIGVDGIVTDDPKTARATLGEP
jgi:glycerophosphoryl diester phosphodiesterase